jgi:hypothetical protein
MAVGSGTEEAPSYRWYQRRWVLDNGPSASFQEYEMQSRRSGLVHTWDHPRRYFEYSYIPRYNETLEIVEVWNATEDLSGNRLDAGTPVQLQALPPEVQAEINISLGSSGMYYYTRTWWERKVVDFHARLHRAGIRLQIWRLKLRIGSNHVRLGFRWIRLQVMQTWMRIRLAGNWCIQRWQSSKIAVIDWLLGEDP